MTQREKNLAIAVVGLVVAYGAWLGWGWWQRATAQRQSDLESAEVAFAGAQLRESVAKASLKKLEDYRERSLPRNPEIAQAVYRDWLVEQFTASGLELESVRRVSAPVLRGDAFTSMTFKAQADGPIDQVSKFLHAFYSSPATHKLTRLKLTPTEPKGNLRIDLDIEAIIVTGASRQAGLPPGPSTRLIHPTVEDYVASVRGRNLFAEYVPPPPPRPPKREVVRATPPPPPPFDDSEHARFTGAVGSGDSMQAWVTVRTTGDVLRLSAGDELKVGLLVGRVLQVGPRELVYEADDKRVRVPLGNTLRDGVPLAGDQLL